MIEELVVISGKGGTGKTSVTASLAALANRPVIADCDVDAPDLHLVLAPEIKERHEFWSGHQAVIDENICIRCGDCVNHCRFGAVGARPGSTANCKDCYTCRRSCPVKTRAEIQAMQDPLGLSGSSTFAIDPLACEGCGVCAKFCPVQAIALGERKCGEWMISATRFGPMVHAQLQPTAENSGKLVSAVSREARRIVEAEHRSLIIVDGPPGIGCPVIASLTGATLVLVVTEPTLSGEHDLERVLALTRHFRIATRVCVNKWDLNPALTARIEEKVHDAGAVLAGRIRYDQAVTLAQKQAKAVIETEAACREDVRAVWNGLGIGESRSETSQDRLRIV